MTGIDRAAAMLAVGTLVLTLAASAAAQGNWPAKPVRVIVPFAAGGATDVVARALGQKLSEGWGQSVVIENRAGAGGNIGADAVAKSPPDGYTLLMTSGSIVTANQYLYKSLPFDPVKDFFPITNVASGPQAIVVHPAVPAKDLGELIAMARSKPKSITFGSAGIGTQTHLAAENFAAAAGIDLEHVPYKGESQAIADLIGGQINMATPNLAAAIGFIQQGKLRALAVTSRTRSPQLPDVPAAAETLTGFENAGWFGLVAPAGTPREIAEKIQRDTVRALSAEDMKTRLAGLGMTAVGDTPEEFARAIAAERKHWAQVVRLRKLTAN